MCVQKLTEPKPFTLSVDTRGSAAADKFKKEMSREIEKEAASFAAFRPSPLYLNITTKYL